MGAGHSREDLDLADSESEYEGEETEEESYETPEKSTSEKRPKTPSSFDEVEAKLKALKLKYPSSASPQTQNPNLKNALKLYLHIGGNTPKAKWVLSEKLTS